MTLEEAVDIVDMTVINPASTDQDANHLRSLKTNAMVIQYVRDKLKEEPKESERYETA